MKAVRAGASIRAAATAALVSMGASSATAAVFGPAWPAPGNVTFVASGTAPGSGVRTNEYTLFDDTFFDGLWWAPWNSTAVGIAMDGMIDEVGETFVLTDGSLGAGWMAGTGTTTIDRVMLGPLPVTTRFRIYVYDLNGSPVPIVTAVSLGLGATAPSLLADVYTAVTTTGGFRADLRAEAWSGSAWQPVNTFFTSTSYTPPSCDVGSGPGVQPGHCVQTSFSGGFFYEPQAVSEPATLASIALGVLVLGWTLRRRDPSCIGGPANA